MSPRELYREIEAAQGRVRDAVELQIHMAWQTGRLVAMAMAGKLPSLKSLLSSVSRGPKPAMSKAQMATTIRMLAASYGHRIEQVAR